MSRRPGMTSGEMLDWIREFLMAQLQSLEGAGESLAISAAVEDEEKSGFRQWEMGTIDAYNRHVVLCYRSAENRALSVESSDADQLHKLLESAIKAREKNITVKTKLSVCEGGEGTPFSAGDVLVFPEMLKYRGLKDQGSVDSFVEDVFVQGSPWKSRVPEKFVGSHVFVETRDGVSRPVLPDMLKEKIESSGLTDRVFVYGYSHIAGPKYAGNLLFYKPDLDGNVTGYWIDFVVLEEYEPELVDQNTEEGETVERVSRSQVNGAPVEEVETVDDGKLNIKIN